MNKKEKTILLASVLATAFAGLLHYTDNAILGFVATAAALALLAMMVGDATEQLGSRRAPGPPAFCNRP